MIGGALLDSLARCALRPRIFNCEPAWRWRIEAMPDYDLWLVLAGEGKLTRNDSPHRLAVGSGFFLRPGDRIAADHNTARPLDVFSCHMPIELVERSRLQEEIRPAFVFGQHLLVSLLAQQAARQTTGDGVDRMMPNLALLQIIALCAISGSGENNPASERLDAVADLMRKAPGNAVDIATLARRAGMSPSHFSRQFRARFGKAPVRFLLEARIERGAQLLRESPMSVSEIADAVGFSSVYHFSRQFGKIVGVPPTVYRYKRLAD